MIAGYADYPGHGNTPTGGVKGFYKIFNRGEVLQSRKNLDNLDAIILWGGHDISPSLYKEKHYLGETNYANTPSQRDIFEWGVLKEAFKKGIPIIGVCRGAQIMCAFAGGKLAQDIHGHHYQHSVVTNRGEIFSEVSSSHHQMMYPFEVDHELLATTQSNLSSYYKGLTDEQTEMVKQKGEPEVVFFPKINGIAIQCHPEWHSYSGQSASSAEKFNSWLYTQIENKLFKD